MAGATNGKGHSRSLASRRDATGCTRDERLPSVRMVLRALALASKEDGSGSLLPELRLTCRVPLSWRRWTIRGGIISTRPSVELGEPPAGGGLGTRTTTFQNMEERQQRNGRKKRGRAGKRGGEPEATLPFRATRRRQAWNCRPEGKIHRGLVTRLHRRELRTQTYPHL